MKYNLINNGYNLEPGVDYAAELEVTVAEDGCRTVHVEVVGIAGIDGIDGIDGVGNED